MINKLKPALMASACLALAAASAQAQDFNIPHGDLGTALDAYMRQAGVTVMYVPSSVRGIQSNGAEGNLSPENALTHLLQGTGFKPHRTTSGAIGILRESESQAIVVPSIELAQAAPARAAVETVTVTSSKLGGADVQSIPIAITALSQEQLTATQTAGGPDLIKQVPNMTFTKTNFSGYSIQIRGIGTQAISVTTDPAVAVALNDVPFIRNHFFEQEFFDLSQAEVLRGPQGTLYGRNATAGVVNLVTARPTDQFEAQASADVGNYKSRRFEGMINIPIIDDRLDLRVAGEWTKRDGFSLNELTNSRIDGRDLWSGRVSLSWHPIEKLQSYLIWEHFSENDDRLRSSKQLCKTTPLPTAINGVPVQINVNDAPALNFGAYLAQGCQAASLYSPESFEVPNGFTLPYFSALSFSGEVRGINPYLNATQSSNLRVIESQLDPTYRAKSDIVELNTDYQLTPTLTLTSTSAYNQDFLWSTEDYNRFASSPGIFVPSTNGTNMVDANGVFCDPQLGCSDRLLAEDLNNEHSWQASQEFRLASHLSGPFNFSVGGNYLHYETEENYYVFINALTRFVARAPWVPGVSDNTTASCWHIPANQTGYIIHDPRIGGGIATNLCAYIDPNPISNLNNEGHNYFLSQNPYTLNSYAAFGETYYDIVKDVKLTTGLRWTEDQKHFVNIPSELVANGWGYGTTGAVDQQWDALSGRVALNWTPKLNFTDQTLVYGSFAHGYKAGGANPPGAVLITQSSFDNPNPVHPLTFKPEFINAFELGSKNTLLNGAITFNASGFYYDYKHYQISEIVDRTSINQNFDAHVKGGEIEASWEPIPGLRFNASGGYEDTRLNDGQSAIDLIDRTAGNSDWMVVKPFVSQASNCILPVYVVAAILKAGFGGTPNTATFACGYAYYGGLDPVTQLPYVENPSVDSSTSGHSYLDQIGSYAGFDPLSVDPNAPANVNNGLGLPPNGGEGFSKDLGGNELPNAPHFTTSISADYTVPVTADWAATLHTDFYWQSDAWARVFNDDPYDKLRGYTNVNLALTLTSQNGWQVMGYLKNVFNTTAITGDFLNSDDSGLTTNIFLTDPRLFGVRVTKNW